MMDKRDNKVKVPISNEKILRIIQWVPVVVSSVFFVKNILGKDMVAMMVIGICLALFVASNVIMRVKNMALYTREMVLAIALPLLVFLISLFSGEAYSDDFVLFLAVIGLSGMFLEPKFTLIQMFMADVFIVLMYIIHPEKAESLGQYIMCGVMFMVAALLYYQVIKRGRAYIQMGEERANEAEKLLASIREMGIDLQNDFAESSSRIEAGTEGLRQGSKAIAYGTQEMADGCIEVHEKIRETEAQIVQLNEGVKNFETVLSENQDNMDALNGRIKDVELMINESDDVLQSMKNQMKEIAGIAKQISDISYKLTILALNASVEAGRAGKAGVGFSVVATNMRELSEQSDAFSERVEEVVKSLIESAEKTSCKFADSREAMEISGQTMDELRDSFSKLMEKFQLLYGNIEEQNNNVNQIDYIFGSLNDRVDEMNINSNKNQSAVETIMDALNIYRDNITKVIEDTQNI